MNKNLIKHKILVFFGFKKDDWISVKTFTYKTTYRDTIDHFYCSILYSNIRYDIRMVGEYERNHPFFTKIIYPFYMELKNILYQTDVENKILKHLENYKDL